MAENTWPLKNTLPEGHLLLTKAELMEILDEVDDETPLWIKQLLAADPPDHAAPGRYDRDPARRGAPGLNEGTGGP